MIALVLMLDAWNGYNFDRAQTLWAAPGLVAAAFVALDWVARVRRNPVLAPFGAVVLLTLCVAGDSEYFAQPRENLRAETGVLPPLLTGDSCVVFVSGGLSKDLFLVFDPHLASRQCHDYFHQRVILASHPYVAPEQQENAESLLRGLNFHEQSRVEVGGGQIVTMQSGGV